MCLQIIEDVLGGPAPEGFLDDLQRHTFAAFREGLKPVPGVREALDAIPWPACVASSGDLLKMRTTLTLAGLIVRFERRMFSALDVPHGKPAPDLFLHAAASMGAAPGDCAVVEDTPTGVEAAVAAGMAVFGYAGGAHSSERALAAAGAIVFRSMSELPVLLRA